MAMPRKIKVEFAEAFPFGVLAVGEVEEMRDFEKSTQAKPVQAKDDESNLPIWTVDVMDADPEVKKANRTVSVRILAKDKPVLPELPAGTPPHLAFMRPVEFSGLTASPYVADSPMGGGKGRLAWSFRASGITAPSLSGSGNGATGGGKVTASKSAASEKAAA